MDTRRTFFAALTCIGLLFTMSCSNKGQTNAGFSTAISPQALKAHLEFLADDALEGRRTGTRGHELAAKYMAAQFAAIGLKGGMPDGSYYQKVPLRRTEVIPEATSILLSGPGKAVKLRYSTDFLLLDTHQAAKGTLSAPVVFAGYGVSAPEMNYDDYAGLDVKGKIVALLLFEAPSKFPATIRAYYTNTDVKTQIAADHGAAGVLTILTPQQEKRIPWQFMQRELTMGYNSMRWLDSQGRIHGLDARSAPSPMLNRSAAEALFNGERYSLDDIFAAAGKGETPRFATNKTVTVQYESRHTPVESANVVALMEGTDPALKSEYVVFSTHIDHLGIGPAVDGDAVYNGALDNASGCAVLLEIARAFSKLPARPRRSVMFVAVTGEEQMLLGSDYFANNSPVSIEKVVADVNFDGPIPLQPSLRDVIVYGSEHSSLGRVAAQAAAESGFTASPDPRPNEGFFVRTDHYSFVKKGVPALYLDRGYSSGEPGLDALKAQMQWSATIYHSPRDEASQKFDYPTGARFARFAGLVGYKVAMQNERPSWNSGDFFGKRFAGAGVK
jgi:Zn-dependent M28 family amino/carboxypeptidase